MYRLARLLSTQLSPTFYWEGLTYSPFISVSSWNSVRHALIPSIPSQPFFCFAYAVVLPCSPTLPRSLSLLRCERTRFMLRQFPGLKKLDLAGLVKVDHAVLKDLAWTLSLTHIDLSRCVARLNGNNITNRTHVVAYVFPLHRPLPVQLRRSDCPSSTVAESQCSSMFPSFLFLL